jgi:hypothetical protein
MSGFTFKHALQETCVETVLSASATKVRKTGPGSWDLVHSNGVKLSVSVRLREGWLFFEAPLARKRWMSLASHPWEVLLMNGRACGPARFALLPLGSSQPGLLAEVALVGDVPVEKRIPEALDSLLKNARLKRRKARGKPDLESGHASDALEAVRNSIEESAWDFETRSNGSLAVQLDPTAGAVRPAFITGRKDGSIELSLPVLSWKKPPHGYSDAFAILLLDVTRSVCMVRAAAENGDERTEIRLEVSLGADPTPGEMDLALGALSVACRECNKELKFLRDPDIAAKYLSVRGGPPTEFQNAKNHSKNPS